MKKQLLNAYFAGLIDGEGTVAIYPQRKNLNMRPVIKVNMTCKKTIDALHAYFGGWCGTTKTPSGNKPQWKWEVTYTKAQNVARIIAPYLITKADEAKAILCFTPKKRGRPSKRSS